MFNCVICFKLTSDKCDRCKERHCEEHPCRIPARPGDMAIIPLLAHSGDPSTGPSDTVSTEEVRREDDTEEEENRNDYLTGLTAAALLAAWIGYATWSDRRGSGLGHQRMQAFRALDRFSHLLLPAESGAMPQSLSVMHWRRYFFTQGFKYGVIPTPMPLPRVVASWSDMMLTARLGLFTLFAKADDFARFRGIIDSAQPSRAIARASGDGIVAARGVIARSGASGFALGTATYSASYSFLVSQVRIPFLAGVLNSSVLSLQIPWDSAMMFNHFAVNIGHNARTLRQMSPVHYNRAMSVMNIGLRPVFNRMMGLGLFSMSLGVGVGVPTLMKKYFSKDDSKKS